MRHRRLGRRDLPGPALRRLFGGAEQVQRALRLVDDGIVDEEAVQLDRRGTVAFRCLESTDDASRESNLLLGWRERAVHPLDLRRIDAHLALETELPGPI